MLDNRQAEKKLYDLPEIFKAHMKCRRYSEAKACYDRAVTIALFMEADEKQKTELFGERGERGVIIKEGLFPEREVQKAYEECIKRGQTRENQKYKPVQGNGA